MSPHVSPAYSFTGSFFFSDSQQVGFYRSFGRPIAKVFLGAMFTYQMTYLLWLKLETEETKADQNGTYRLPSLIRQSVDFFKRNWDVYNKNCRSLFTRNNMTRDL